MRIVDRYMKKPHLLLSLVVLGVIIGAIGYVKIPINQFPDVERPQIAVVTVEPGAAATDIESDVSRPIEDEVSTLENVRKVTSTSKDEVSVVNVEFRYMKGLNAAATDVQTAISKIQSQLPRDIQPPMIFKISSATPAVLTLALRPKPGSPLDLSMVRQLADNQIKNWLLQLPEVSNVEVFGGNQPVIQVDLDQMRLYRYGLTPQSVQTALAAFNSNQPMGLVISNSSQYLFKMLGEFTSIQQIGQIVVAHRQDGDVHLRDIAHIFRSAAVPQSAYHANGHPAIAINIERALTGHALDTFNSVMVHLPQLERAYPGISFTVPDAQGHLIQLSVSNMKDALRDAIIMTVIVIFIFLADIPLMMLAAVSLPLTFLMTFAIMWLTGMEFNIVTLTATTVAVGMLLDDAIVVLENIERHYKSLGKSPYDSAVGGTEEVMLAIFSGTYATIMVLVPVAFIGGYVQQVLRPYTTTLIIALISSYLVSITVIPILSPLLLRVSAGRKRTLLEKLVRYFDDRVITPLREFYVRAVTVAIRYPLLFLPPAMIALMLTNRQMPIVGRDLMSPMDSGIIKISFQTYANTSLAGTKHALSKMEKIVLSQPGAESVSSTIGSEPAVVSFGSQRTAQQCDMTAHFINRFRRKKTIWQIEDTIRNEGRHIPGIQYLDVYDYGATPLSTISAPVDVMISGPDLTELQKLGTEMMHAIKSSVRGLTSIRLSWQLASDELAFHIIPERAAMYQTSPAVVAAQLQGAIRGLPSSLYRVPNQTGLYLWVQYPSPDRMAKAQLMSYQIQTPYGQVPLRSFGTLTTKIEPSVITHQGLQRTIDIKAYRSRVPITQLQMQVDKAISKIPVPPGYKVTQEGEVKLLNESFKSLMMALMLGIVLLYFSLVPAFKSWIHPLTILVAVPFGLIGAIWGLLITGLHSNMPGMMGMILLAGIVVKNSILLIDFIAEARARGDSVQDALIGSVRIRTRPILMTAVGTAVGMIPIAMGWAIGLEKLQSLAVVSIFGLLVSTVLTLIYVPIFYQLFDGAANWIQRAFRRMAHQPAVSN